MSGYTTGHSTYLITHAAEAGYSAERRGDGSTRWVQVGTRKTLEAIERVVARDIEQQQIKRGVDVMVSRIEWAVPAGYGPGEVSCGRS